MSTRSRILIATIALVAGAGLLCVVPNPLLDRVVGATIARRIGLPAHAEGARLRHFGMEVACRRLALGNPQGFGEGDLGTLDDVSVVFSRPFGVNATEIAVQAETAEFHVVRAGTGEISLAAIHGATSSLSSLGLKSLAIRVDDRASGAVTWLRDGRLSYVIGAADPDANMTSLDFTARYESGATSTPLEWRYEDSGSGERSCHFSGHGIDLATLSPILASIVAGARIGGHIDLELDAAVDLRAGRVAISGDGSILGLALVAPALSTTMSIGERLLKIHGGLDIDLSKQEVRAESFVLESEFLFMTANGVLRSNGTVIGANETALEAVVSCNLDRGEMGYRPLLAWLLPSVRAGGLVELHVDSPKDGSSHVKLETERCLLELRNGKRVRLLDSLFEGRVTLGADRIDVRDARIATTFVDVAGSFALSDLHRDAPTLSLLAEGSFHTQRLVDPVTAFLGTIPLQMNGDLGFKASLERNAEQTKGTLTLDTDDTDVRYDDLRDGVADVWDFRGMPMHGELAFLMPRTPTDLARQLDLDGRIAATKAILLRDELIDLDLPIHLQKGALRLGPWSARLAGGDTEGTIDAEFLATGGASIHAQASVRETELKLFPAIVTVLATGVTAAPLAPFRTTATNRVSGRLDVTGHGDSITSFLRTLDGRGSVDVGGGVITGAPVLDLFTKPASDGDAGRRIDRLRADFEIDDGRLRSDAVELVVAERTLRLKGGANSSGAIDFVVDPADWLGLELWQKAKSDLGPHSFRIDGHYDSPRLHLPDPTIWSRAPQSELSKLVRDFTTDK